MHVNDIFIVEGGPTHPNNYSYLDYKVKTWERMLMVWDYKFNLFTNLISYYKINFLIYFE
jgi:hypothetical protein